MVTEPSVGDGFVQAFEAALQDAELAEAKIDFVAGNYNGERYDAWELSHAQTRCYRTRRERLPTLWPARSTGEMGVAGGAMAVIAAAHAIAEGYAVGPIATVQVRSEGALRGILVLE
jgi:3-oxoacyl-[acyl-carrier-protein] synthase-1